LDAIGGELVGELDKWVYVAECKPWKHNNVELRLPCTIAIAIAIAGDSHLFFG